MAHSMDQIMLRPLTEQDIPGCARIAGLTFDSDRQTQFKAGSPTAPYNHEDGMRQGLNHWLSGPKGKVELTVAVDKSTQEIMGWVAWGFRGFNSAEGVSQQAKEPKQVEELKQSAYAEAPNSTTTAQTVSSAKSSRIRLEQFTSDDMAIWMKRLMPLGTKCMFICSIAVHPSCQGKGVGSALIQKGTDRADQEGVFCWVHASEAGAGMFAHRGFREVGRLDIDLDVWNTEGITPPSGTKWGVYTFRYMRRDPVD